MFPKCIVRVCMYIFRWPFGESVTHITMLVMIGNGRRRKIEELIGAKKLLLTYRSVIIFRIRF